MNGFLARSLTRSPQPAFLVVAALMAVAGFSTTALGGGVKTNDSTSKPSAPATLDKHLSGRDANDDWLGMAKAVIDGKFVRPADAAAAWPVWGNKDGLLIGLYPMPGPRGLLRVYSTYIGQGIGRMVNFIAVEPILQGQPARDLSELQHSLLDNAPGKRFWASNDPANNTPRLAEERPARGVVTREGGVDFMRVYIMVETLDSGTKPYLRLTFRSDRPYEVGIATFADKDSKPMDRCIVTSTMGNFARLRQLYLADGVVTAGSLWPDLKSDDFGRHFSFGVNQLAAARGGGVIVAATGDEKDPKSVADGFPHPGWRYIGNKATQYWRCEKPGKDLVAMVNGRYTYWGSKSPIPGGVAFENFELNQPFQDGAEYWFGVTPKSPEAMGMRMSTTNPTSKPSTITAKPDKDNNDWIFMTGQVPVVEGAFVRPADAAVARPVWGNAKGLQIGLAPMPGPRGLIRIYAPHLGHGMGRMINYFAVEPIVAGHGRDLSEVQHSVMDNVQGKRFWATNDPADNSPKVADERPARGVVTREGGVDYLRVYIMMEALDSGARPYLRLTFRSDRPDEVGVATFADKDSKPMDRCIVTSTMGNFARLRQLHLADRIVTAGSLWPDLTSDEFGRHFSYGVKELPAWQGGGVIVAATGDEKDTKSVVDGFDAFPNAYWRYTGSKATQYWRCEKPDKDLVAMVNGRYTFWASKSPIPGGVAFENFELAQPFRDGQEYWFGVTTKTPEAPGLTTTTTNPATKPAQ